MAERDAQFLQIGLGQIWQDFEIDGILGKSGRVLGEPNPIKPGFYLVIVAHCRVRPQRYCYIFPLSSLHILLCARAAPGHAMTAPRPRDDRTAEQRDEVVPLDVRHGDFLPYALLARRPTHALAFSGTSACRRGAG